MGSVGTLIPSPERWTAQDAIVVAFVAGVLVRSVVIVFNWIAGPVPHPRHGRKVKRCDDEQWANIGAFVGGAATLLVMVVWSL